MRYAHAELPLLHLLRGHHERVHWHAPPVISARRMRTQRQLHVEDEPLKQSRRLPQRQLQQPLI
jgi:hypothetical protein